MQITANFVNDYIDFTKGRDDADRLGPERACAQGWISPEAMRRGIFLATVGSALVGLPLVLWGGWPMLLVGAVCILFCFLYSTSLATRGLGDVLVLLFFGLVPVCATFFLQTDRLTPQVVAYAIAQGLVTDTLLLVNNYRDREQDATKGKRTLAVYIGARATEWLYLGVGLAAMLLVQAALWTADGGWVVLLPLLYLPSHFSNFSLLRSIRHGRALNRVLGRTALAILGFSLLLSLAILL